VTPLTPYREPTQQSGRAFWQRGIAGPVVMLNLLRFRKIADYSADPELAPATPISGAEAFDRYVAHTLPYLQESVGALLFLGEGGGFLIGPAEERWDRVMLVRQSSVDSSWLSPATPAIWPASAIARRRSKILGCCR
jgi:hypothetical protein